MIDYKQEQELFFDKTERALRSLFTAAKEKNELHFCLSLSPEFRGEQSAGWCTASEAMQAFDGVGKAGIHIHNSSGMILKRKSRLPQPP